MSRGLAAAAFMFLMVGVTQFNDGPFSRPHPAIWRLVLAASVLYWLCLVFMLFQVWLQVTHQILTHSHLLVRVGFYRTSILPLVF